MCFSESNPAILDGISGEAYLRAHHLEEGAYAVDVCFHVKLRYATPVS